MVINFNLTLCSSAKGKPFELLWILLYVVMSKAHVFHNIPK